MAKQKGIHQLKGKVGGMSYYQQSGVTDGLVRRIPEGLSSRVKTADEYANTRLNNDEFKNANGIATFAFRAIPNRKASMTRRFAIAEMTKSALEFIKTGTGDWGLRIPDDTFDNIVVDMLERHAKSGPYAGEFGLVSFDVDSQTGQYTVSDELTQIVADDLNSKGISGFYMLSVRGCMAEVVTRDGFVRQIFGISSINPVDVVTDDISEHTCTTFIPGPATLGLSNEGFSTAVQTSNNGMFALVTFLPYREISGSRYTLYEYATYCCIPLGQLPE